MKPIDNESRNLQIAPNPHISHYISCALASKFK
jgi:hypothetical protein